METLQEDPPQVYGIGSRIRMDEWINSSINHYEMTILTNHTIHELNSQVELPDADGIPGVDIRLVSQQAGVTAEQALDALRRNTGDIVNSIMELTNS
jgi:NACalpha-BTF3-like transcription factor